MKFLNRAPRAFVCLLLGTMVALKAQPEREKQAEPPKQEKAAPARQQAPPAKAQQQPQRAEQPKQQAQPPRAQTPAPKAQAPQQKAQQPQRAQEQPKQAAPQQKAAQQPRQAQPAQRAANYAPPQRSTQQAQAWQQKGGWKASGGWQGGASFQAGRATNWGSEHRTWAQRGGYGGYYIPQASFGLYFGVGHMFQIGSQPFMVGGYPEFRYGGYTFMMVDPWPGDWSPNWYSADQMYVGYDNGYYLYDQMHPGEAVALTVVM